MDNNNKYFRNWQAGFAPLIVIAIIAVLVVGGGVYMATKDKGVEPGTETDGGMEGDINTEAGLDMGAELNANTSGSLRSLMGLGRSVTCTFTSTAGGVSSAGTVYVASAGNMRGDFSAQTSAGAISSSMILKDGYSYVWSGSQGAKISVQEMNSNASVGAEAQQSVDLDQQVDYDCSPWNVDQAKFNLPTNVNFLDIEAMMQGQGGQ